MTTVIVDITGRCNLKCKYCYNSKYQADALNQKNLHKIIKNLTPETSICFLGGEPLTSPYLFDAIAYCISNSIQCSVTTNGTLVKKVGIAKILNSGISELTFSLDGPDPSTNDELRGLGSFQQCIDSLKACDQYAKSHKVKCDISISSTVSKVNLSSIELMLDLIGKLELYIHKLWLTPMLPIGRGEKERQDCISEVEWVQLCDKICRKWKKFPRISYLAIPNSEIVVRVLSSRHHILLTDSVPDCPPLTGSASCRVLADGRIVPCNGREDLLEKLEDNVPWYSPSSIEKVGNECNLLKPFSLFVCKMNNFRYQSNTFCNHCPFRHNCFACPLEEYFKTTPRRKIPLSCKEALRLVGHQKPEELKVEKRAPSRKNNYSLSVLNLWLKNGTLYLKERRNGEKVFFIIPTGTIATLNKECAKILLNIIEDGEFSVNNLTDNPSLEENSQVGMISNYLRVTELLSHIGITIN